jgi:hypothetical protein
VGSVSVWEAVFMLVVLKLPMVYLCIVVWWAIRAEPRHEDGPDAQGAFVPLTPCGWGEWRRRRAARHAVLRPFGHRNRPTRQPRLGVSA